MPIYHLPPSPFVGGRQPLAPKDLNPSIEDNPVIIDNPPPRKLGVLAAIFIAWQPLAIPQQPQKAVPSEEQQVPFTRNLEIILNNWNVTYSTPILPHHLPQVSVKFIPGPDVPTVDDAPVSSSRLNIILSNWQDRLSFIQINPKIPISVDEDFVPYLRPQLYITINEYRPEFKKPSAVLEGFTPPVVDDPPFGQRIWLNTVLDLWRPPYVNIVRPVLLPQELPGDNPPFGRRVLWLNTIMDAWIPPPPMPTFPILGYNPPDSSDIIIWLWKRVL